MSPSHEIDNLLPVDVNDAEAGPLADAEGVAMGGANYVRCGCRRAKWIRGNCGIDDRVLIESKRWLIGGYDGDVHRCIWMRQLWAGGLVLYVRCNSSKDYGNPPMLHFSGDIGV